MTFTYPLESDNARLRSLFELTERYERGELIPPPHQRKARWNTEKKKGYVKRVRQSRLQPSKSSRPPGGFETYQIITQPKNIYLNDGNNRLTALVEYLANALEYGDSTEEAINILRSIEVAVNHHHYEDHLQAHFDFVLVNAGEMATPYEQCKGFLVYFEEGLPPDVYEELWQDLHNIIPTIGSVIIAKPPSSTKLKHKNLRHDYSLFYRYVSGEKETSSHGIYSISLSANDLENSNFLESKLRKYVSEKTIEDLRQDIKNFRRTIELETATITEIWNGIRKKNNLYLSRSCYRWILDVAIWKKHNKIPNQLWVEFLKCLLNETQGKAMIPNVHNPSRYRLLSVSDLAILKTVCDMIGSNLYYWEKSKPPSDDRIKPGYDQSHIDPDEPKTIIEPAGSNRARGKKHIKEFDPLGMLETGA